MDEYDDMSMYNGDAEHDMWVDFTYHQNTGELDELFDDDDNSFDRDWNDEY
ncbi:MAG: hypothetical protein J1E63_06825 [Muribaculaceae bacterium]|nr:hypothetical protein [Muribaculaceae bacterium]